MTLAYWCVLIVMLLPLVAAASAKLLGKMPASDNHNPRAFLDQVTGKAKRANNAQLNSHEIAPFFAAAIIIAQQIGQMAQSTIDVLAISFVISRVLYLIAYIADWASLRSLIWLAGLGLLISLFMLSA
ncbi:MAPEG family protein [Thiopseudomonas alkaliphila]|uniref:MAPEG family protein n=1 Tax=Thiopseudomonas alkaliphila TaxID=1697053 RepID=UPI00069F3BF7|nr:MAPEG family protein [Thiopseudomonas alkaliphila]AKX51130.1 hypothetical protein AKN92_06160 [Thiopseudomonas alkaliphila]AKX57498.1 hypothetical protein AKN89_06405 [Thiopseudomonas alkaliphila]